MFSLWHLLESIVLLSITIPTSASSDEIDSPSFDCARACVLAFESDSFNDCNQTAAALYSDAGCPCTSDLFAQLVSICLDDFCDLHGAAGMYDHAAEEFCIDADLEGLALPYAEALSIGLSKIVSHDAVHTANITSPFHLSSATFYDVYYRTVYTYYHELGLGLVHGGITMAFLGAVIILAMLRTVIVKLMYPHSQIRSLITKRPDKLTRLLQRHLIYPSTFSHSHAVHPRLFGLTLSIPTRAQTIVIFIYLSLTLGLMCSELTNISFPENVYWTKENYAWTRYLADRAGTMAVSQLPFIFLFGGRNNILIPLTGWDYSTFSVYHKCVSRTMVALALVHTFAYIASSFIRGGYADLAKHASKNYYIWGFVAMGVSSTMIVQSVYNLRKLAYDVFSVLHIILAALFLAAMKWHLDPHGWMEWIWASVAIWAFDRFIRLIRLVYFNLGLSSTATAQVELLSHDNLALLKFKVRPVRSATFTPGKYVFLHIGGVAPWSAHPVSVIDQDEDGSYKLAMTVHQGLTRKLYHRLSKDSAPDKLSTEVSKTATLRVGIDGFYGHTAPVDLYDSVLLIAGGIGITAVIGYVKALALNRKSYTKHVTLVWVVRDFVCLDWFREQLGQLVDLDAEHVGITIRLYVTSVGVAAQKSIDVARGQSYSGRSSSTNSDSAENVKKAPTIAITATSPSPNNNDNNNEKSTFFGAPSITSLPVSYTRPDMGDVISDFVHNAPASIAVLACGPAGMVDDIRHAVCCNIETARARLDYFEEAFGW